MFSLSWLLGALLDWDRQYIDSACQTLLRMQSTEAGAGYTFGVFPMNVPNSTVAVRPGDCFDHWFQVTCREFSLTECRRVADREFQAQISIRNFDALMVNDIWSSTRAQDRICVTRSPGDIRRDPRDYFMLWLSISGETVLTQNGREARMQRGDLVLHDQAQPFTLEFGERSRSIMISIPRPLLISRLHCAPDLAARQVSSRSRLGALAGSIVRQLARLDDRTTDDVVRQLSTSVLDIFAMTMQSELTEGGEPRHGPQRLDRVKKYILANLRDSKLDLDAIATAQNISPSTLNRLFAREGTTPIRWLWQQRLAASYRALAERHVSQVTDAALTFGFSDVSHFSRAFKAAFGRSPHDLKRQL